MSTTSSGREAEQLVATRLISQGHTIIDMNWRTRWCEIDIVSRHKGIVYFTEVKYRKSSAWGDGLSYVTPRKLSQMRFSAEFWMSTHNHTKDARLQVASVGPEGIESIITIDDE